MSRVEHIAGRNASPGESQEYRQPHLTDYLRLTPKRVSDSDGRGIPATRYAGFALKLSTAYGVVPASAFVAVTVCPAAVTARVA